MRVRVVEVEGSPEELAQLPELREALFGPAASDVVAAERVEPGVPIAANATRELSEELRDFIAVRAGNRGRAGLVQRWVAEVLGWGTTVPELGRSRTSSDGLNNYLMLYATGPRRFGAFAYVMPGNGKVIFRLTARDAEGYAHATVRNVKSGTGYEVTVLLDGEDAYADAVALAKKALSRVR